MRLEFLFFDVIILSSVIIVCVFIIVIIIGFFVYVYFIKEGLLFVNIYVGIFFLNFYVKCGDVVLVRKVFDDMEEKNVVIWSLMIRGYGMYGDGNEFFLLFNDMLRENVKFNEVIFIVVLLVCSYIGNVGEGWKCFISMCREYNFVFTMKYYACMVDILVRGGKLEEAVDFMEKMLI